MEILNHQRYFVKNLIKWNRDENTRDMPWKGEKDPYKIWLSEIILQQTRVIQGLDYYHRFVNSFPTIGDLAAASEKKVFKLWEGLGYYTRCKNLIATAKYVSEQRFGKFPEDYDEILALKGIGPYTAAAISSFAFNLPYAVVDGNVFRVLSRFFGIATPTDSKEGIKLFNELANKLLDVKNPGTYNQALMDFGAVICKPQLPLCADCMLRRRCVAFLQGSVHQLPVKEKSIVKKTRWFYYLVINYNDNLYVQKRTAGDIWENLYQFVLIESKEAVAFEYLSTAIAQKMGNTPFKVESVSEVYKQLLTHQTIFGQFIYLKITAPFSLKGHKATSKKALQKLPFPKFISNYLKDKNVSLNLF